MEMKFVLKNTNESISLCFNPETHLFRRSITGKLVLVDKRYSKTSFDLNAEPTGIVVKKFKRPKNIIGIDCVNDGSTIFVIEQVDAMTKRLSVHKTSALSGKFLTPTSYTTKSDIIKLEDGVYVIKEYEEDGELYDAIVTDHHTSYFSRIYTEEDTRDGNTVLVEDVYTSDNEEYPEISGSVFYRFDYYDETVGIIFDQLKNKKFFLEGNKYWHAKDYGKNEVQKNLNKLAPYVAEENAVYYGRELNYQFIKQFGLKK